MRFGVAPHDSVEPFTFGVAPLSARAIKVRSYADGNGADGNVNERVNAGEKVIFSASSVDDSLLLRGLSVGPAYLRFALEERAYVTREGVNLPSSFRERITQNPTQATLLLIATVGLVMSLVYTLARL
jgi:hypothetical protein